jgi:hypothetical protein
VEELQNELNEILKKIEESGFKINEDFKLYNPNELVYAVEQYWRHEGAYESQGKVRETHYVRQINEKAYTELCEGIKSNAQDFMEKVYDDEIDIKGFGIGLYPVYECDEGELFVDDMKVKYCDNGSIKLDFGSHYREGFGGYIIFKQMPLSEINEFEEIDIDTFD